VVEADTEVEHISVADTSVVVISADVALAAVIVAAAIAVVITGVVGITVATMVITAAAVGYGVGFLRHGDRAIGSLTAVVGNNVR